MFGIALSNVLLTLLYITPGFLLGKARKAVTEHLSTVSAFLIYACSSSMVVSSFTQLEPDRELLGMMAIFAVLTIVLQLLAVVLLYLAFRKKYDDARYRILTIGSVLGNVGFFGLPIVKALLPEFPEVVCFSSIYVVTMNLFVFTVGVFCLTTDKKYISLKAAVCNPTVISFAIAFPLFLLSARNFIPSMIMNAVDLLSAMTTPICMFILGVRLSTAKFRDLFARPFVYAVTAGKLIVYPLFCYGLTLLFSLIVPLPVSIVKSVLVLSAVPSASVILNLAEMHHKCEDLAANCLLISTLLCFLTIPVLTLLIA